MRTIKKNLMNRLQAQADEAKVQGIKKVAANLEKIIKTQPTRDNDSSYIYSHSDFSKDVEELLWKIAMRTADFYDCNMDTLELQKRIESTATDFLHELRVLGHIEHGVGAYEPNIPGEISEHIAIEIEEE